MNRMAFVGFLISTVCLSSTAPALAQEEEEVEEVAEGALVTLQGEVIDPALYLREGRHGPEAEGDTYEALDGGQSLALLEDESDTLYLLLAEEPGEDPNELVYDYVNQRLAVTGTVYERAGLKGIVIQSVEPLADADTTAVEPQAIQ